MICFSAEASDLFAAQKKANKKEKASVFQHSVLVKGLADSAAFINTTEWSESVRDYVSWYAALLVISVLVLFTDKA